MTVEDRIAGVLLGTAVGDALGLPREGLPPARAAKRFGTEVRHRFLFGRGMVSDDTEHACMTAQALLASRSDPARFARSLAWRLRFWLLGLPAGAGFATLRSVLKLWIGFPPGRSGVFSAGNGPAMRSALIGVVFRDDDAKLAEFVRASTRLTHTDPLAEEGALAVAIAAAFASRIEGPPAVREVLRALWDRCPGARFRDALDLASRLLEQGAAPSEFARALGLEGGVTGFILHTVPAALYCWLRHPGDFRRAVEDAILLGGDTDTVAAIAGALAGAEAGAGGIPEDWISGLWEWPCGAAWMKELASRLSDRFFRDGPDLGPLFVFLPGVPPRNLLFLAVVLLHGFRRLLPSC